MLRPDQVMVNKTGVIEKIGNKVHFEVAFEEFDLHLEKITDNLI